MKQLTRTLLAATLALGLSGTAFASAEQSAQSGQRAERMEKMGEHRAERMAKMAERRAERQAKLHDALNLTGQQEQAWAAFQASMAPQPRANKVDREALRALPAPQRMAQRIAFSKQRIAKMEARQAALASFYAVLSPEQQKTFEAVTERRGHRGGFRGQRRHG